MHDTAQKFLTIFIRQILIWQAGTNKIVNMSWKRHLFALNSRRCEFCGTECCYYFKQTIIQISHLMLTVCFLHTPDGCLLVSTTNPWLFLQEHSLLFSGQLLPAGIWRYRGMIVLAATLWGLVYDHISRRLPTSSIQNIRSVHLHFLPLFSQRCSQIRKSFSLVQCLGNSAVEISSNSKTATTSQLF